MIQFYAPDIKETLTLPESDSGHCIRVLRMSAGDIIQVVDGKGVMYTCRITIAHKDHTRVEIIDEIPVDPPYKTKVIIGVAPTKNMDRMEWLVEKLTEIGVDRIVPLLCHRSERREIKLDRLVKTAVSAMKQSLKATLPAIDPMTRLSDFVGEFSSADSQRYIAYCDEFIPRVALASRFMPDSRDTVILIGPEGDFDESEVKASFAAGFVPVTLGPCRLRTETAAFVACDTCRIIEQRNT